MPETRLMSSCQTWETFAGTRMTWATATEPPPFMMRPRCRMGGAPAVEAADRTAESNGSTVLEMLMKLPVKHCWSVGNANRTDFFAGCRAGSGPQ